MTQENGMASEAYGPSLSDGFDIGSIDVAATATFNVDLILDANGDPKSGFVIVGKNSDEYKAAAKRIRVEGLQRSAQRKGPLDTSKAEGAEALASAIEANDITQASAVVCGWFGFADKGVVAEFNAKTARAMLVKFPTWRQKVLEALEDDANFIKG